MPNGEPIPTYDNGDITELARVFTGLYFASPYGWGGGGWADEHFTLPMVMYPERHDFEAKHLPNGVMIPAREVSETNGTQDVRDAVEALFRHPNTPPFVCRQLIQFLVTDNPTPGYIQRVQDVFVNDGTGVRGNLAAVVKAILLDPEARNQPLSPTYGKVREPVIRTMHLGRLFHLPQAHPKFVWWNWTENFYGPSIQEPMNSPSVFNFYTPVYQAPGEIRNAGLVSPGFQIINTYSAVSFPNLLWDYLHDGFKSAYDLAVPARLQRHPAARGKSRRPRRSRRSARLRRQHDRPHPRHPAHDAAESGAQPEGPRRPRRVDRHDQPGRRGAKIDTPNHHPCAPAASSSEKPVVPASARLRSSRRCST